MCFTLFKPKYERHQKTLLSFAIVDYLGSGNDLSFCLNDQANFICHSPDFYVRQFTNSAVTCDRFIAELKQAKEHAIAGDVIWTHYSGHGTYVKDQNYDEPDGYDEALYLYDGALVDDRINEALKDIPEGVVFVFFLDCCYSETATKIFKEIKTNKKTIRFLRLKNTPKYNKRVKGFMANPTKWLVFSACREHEEAAEDIIGTSGNGVFTYYLLKTKEKGITYTDWYNRLRNYLPSNIYPQTPILEGSENLKSLTI